MPYRFNPSSPEIGQMFTVTCYTCGMPSSKEWAQLVRTTAHGGEPYYPFLLESSAPTGAIVVEGSIYLCAFCHALLESQWNTYEGKREVVPPAKRKYNIHKFICAVCGVETYRKRVRALPFQEFPFLMKERQPESITLGNNPLAVVCLDCSETLWSQNSEYERWGLPTHKRHYNWMCRPPPPEDSVESSIARLPSGETQLPRCPPTDPLFPSRTGEPAALPEAIVPVKSSRGRANSYSVQSPASSGGSPRIGSSRKKSSTVMEPLLIDSGSMLSPPILTVSPISLHSGSRKVSAVGCPSSLMGSASPPSYGSSMLEKVRDNRAMPNHFLTIPQNSNFSQMFVPYWPERNDGEGRRYSTGEHQNHSRRTMPYLSPENFFYASIQSSRTQTEERCDIPYISPPVVEPTNHSSPNDGNNQNKLPCNPNKVVDEGESQADSENSLPSAKSLGGLFPNSLQDGIRRQDAILPKKRRWNLVQEQEESGGDSDKEEECTFPIRRRRAAIDMSIHIPAISEGRQNSHQVPSKFTIDYLSQSESSNTDFNVLPSSSAPTLSHSTIEPPEIIQPHANLQVNSSKSESSYQEIHTVILPQVSGQETQEPERSYKKDAHKTKTSFLHVLGLKPSSNADEANVGSDSKPNLSVNNMAQLRIPNVGKSKPICLKSIEDSDADITSTVCAEDAEKPFDLGQLFQTCVSHWQNSETLLDILMTSAESSLDSNAIGSIQEHQELISNLSKSLNSQQAELRSRQKKCKRISSKLKSRLSILHKSSSHATTNQPHP